MIYFIGADQAKDVKTLIDIGFSSIVGSNLHRGGYYFRQTFSDKQLTIQQCHAARRSFYDLLEIAQTYFPQTTPQQLAYILLNQTDLSAFYCSDIKKVVFVHERSKGGFLFDSRMQERYTADYIDVEMNMCFNDIKNLSEQYEKEMENTKELQKAIV